MATTIELHRIALIRLSEIKNGEVFIYGSTSYMKLNDGIGKPRDILCFNLTDKRTTSLPEWVQVEQSETTIVIKPITK